MIPKEKLYEFRDKIKNSSRPLIFFDDDCDGVSSFIQYYWINTDSRGVIVKGKPELEERFVKNVDENGPDLVVVLDKPLVSEDFFNGVSQEKIWLDHHPVQDPKGVFYLNPLNYSGESLPTSYFVYKSLRDEDKKSLWMAMVGVLGDWDMSLGDEFKKEYPDLLPQEITTPKDALFNSKIGLLVKIINFNLKGKTSDVMKSVKTLTRISDPYEILEQKSSRGKFIYKKYEKVNKVYEMHKKNVSSDDSIFVIYKYGDTTSITGDLSNELIYEYPDKVIVVGREHNGKVMMSIRSGKYKVVDVLAKSLEGFDGYGGGHDYACGGCVREEDFYDFIEKFKSGFLNN
ncbi:MAG: DHH family phosphoesterase [Candidatus Woesearchaeota archaeon]